VAGHAQAGVDAEASFLGRQTEAGDEWVGPHPNAPDEGAGGDEFAIGQGHAVRGGFLHRDAHADVHPSTPEDPVRGAGQARVEFGQDPLGDIEEQPVGAAVDSAPGVQAAEVIGVQHAVSRHLRTGIAGTDHDEGVAGGTLVCVLGDVSEDELAGDVVAQVEGFG
jgi:hypothetical protein